VMSALLGRHLSGRWNYHSEVEDVTMFTKECAEIREAVYGVRALTPRGPQQSEMTQGSGFMIAPGVVATAAHLVHTEGDTTKPLHVRFEVIRAPEVGAPPTPASLIGEDITRDVALLQVPGGPTSACVRLAIDEIPKGTPCGSLGFPFSTTEPSGAWNLVERFQHAYVSALVNDGTTSRYETDTLMYGGSSGCPGFVDGALVIGMQSASRSEPGRPPAPPPPPRKGFRQPKKSRVTQAPTKGTRVAISLWVPSFEIIAVAKDLKIVGFA